MVHDEPIPPARRSRTLHLAFLWILALVVIGFEWWTYSTVEKEHFNYIFQESSDLRQHSVSLAKADDPPAIMILGTSSAAGNFVPPKTTVSDYINAELGPKASYGLAALQGNIITSISILRLTEKVPTRWVTFGICPDLFPINDVGSPFISRNINLLNGVLSPELVHKLRVSRYGKLDYVRSILGDTGLAIPTQAYIAVRSKLLALQRSLYGNLFKFDLLGMPHLEATEVLSGQNELIELLPVLKRLSEERGARFLAYFEPVLEPYSVYGEENFKAYQKKVTALLEAQHIQARDFTFLLPNTHDYFMDSQHLSPLGNKTLAGELLRTFRDEEAKP